MLVYKLHVCVVKEFTDTVTLPLPLRDRILYI